MATPEYNDSAKVFMAGKSQAVRLPKKYRFPEGCDEVSIRRVGGAVILTPRYKTWDELLAQMGPGDDEFVEAVISAKQEYLGEDLTRASFDE